MCVAEGYAHRKGRAAVDLALDRDAAAVQFDEFPHQGKADAAALVRSASLPFDSVETLKQQWQFRRRNANAGIADRQPRRVVDLPQADGDGALECKLEGVRDKIED